MSYNYNSCSYRLKTIFVQRTTTVIVNKNERGFCLNFRRSVLDSGTKNGSYYNEPRAYH